MRGTTNQTTTPTTARERLAARVAQYTTAQIVVAYRTAAQRFERNPRGRDADELLIILSALDVETTHRDIPCCPECSVPTAARWHATSLHDTSSPAGQLANALTNAALAVATRPRDGS